ncbi:hypothetical protein [Nocardioides albus]|uniref:Uncharacterized protein n=1 Tax=Nocardioides albus TaxID=1841 RepID=A0A7W5F6H8_9ACTN|nr:hypothetical protein [Nocardioides albus]MBB3087173.1 hypothetical protein [Nocardioides albus]GGU07157.1 hypothetical protein GCM10007979_00940 [Nocardioides albus]
MNLKRLILFVLLGVLVGITIFWVPGRFADSAAIEDDEGSAGASASQSGSPGAAASSEPSTGSGLGRTSKPATEALPKAASTPTESGLPGLAAKPRTKTAALVSEPLPKQAVRKDALVAGYPTALAPPSRTTVDVSSVSPTTGVLQVALTASCRKPCDVLRHYRTRLAQHGFKEVTTTSVENTPVTSLSRGDETVSVTVTRTSRRHVDFSLYSVLRTKS